jgi:hypothetical protein
VSVNVPNGRCAAAYRARISSASSAGKETRCQAA